MTAVINGWDLLLVGVGLACLAWIVLTYDPKGDEQRKKEKRHGTHDVIVTCANAEDQAEVFYILASEVDGGILPSDAHVHMNADPHRVPSAKVTAIRAAREDTQSVEDSDMCTSCIEDVTTNECKRSPLDCGHHSNGTWRGEPCDYCGRVFDVPDAEVEDELELANEA